MTTQRVEKTVFATVEKVADVDGRDGPQREVTMEVPWSDYPVRFWLDRDTPPFPKAGDHCWVKFNRGRIKDGGDPERDWSYRWYIADYNVEAPPEGESETSIGSSVPANSGPSSSPKTITARGPGAGSQPTRERSIERQVAFKVVGDLILNGIIKPYEAHFWTEYFARCIAGEIGGDDFDVMDQINESVKNDPDSLVATSTVVVATEAIKEAIGNVERLDEISKEEQAILQMSNDETPNCDQHNATFTWRVGNSGEGRWCHQKEAGAWCLRDAGR